MLGLSLHQGLHQGITRLGCENGRGLCGAVFAPGLCTRALHQGFAPGQSYRAGVSGCKKAVLGLHLHEGFAQGSLTWLCLHEG